MDLVEFSIDILDEIDDNKKDKDKVKDLFKQLEDAWEYGFEELEEDLLEVEECSRFEKFSDKGEDIEDDFDDEIEDFIKFIEAECIKLQKKERKERPLKEKVDMTMKIVMMILMTMKIVMMILMTMRRQTEESYSEDQWLYDFSEGFMDECTSEDYSLYEYCECTRRVGL